MHGFKSPWPCADRPQHYELVSEHDLTTAQAALLGEIEPEVEQLLARVDAHLDRLARREQSLIARADLQAGRLSSYGASASTPKKVAAKGLNAVEEIKATQLRQKKERLSYAVSRLELQANQRERQLRKSMAAQ